MSVHQTKDGRWYSTWYEGKKKKFKYFGRGDIAKLRAERHDEQIKRDKGKLDIPGGMIVAELLNHYHESHPVEKSTGNSDYYRMTKILVPALGNYQAETLSSLELNQFLKARLDAGRKRRTAAREIDILRAAYNWAAAQDPPLVIRNPLVKYRVPKARDSDVPSPPSPEEAKRLMRSASPQLLRALLIGWYCGVRPGGEITRITWSDCDFHANEIRIVSARKGGAIVRYVPMHDHLREMLQKWRLEDASRLQEGQGIESVNVVHFRLQPVQTLKKSWAAAKKRAGITRRLRPYDLRHAWFTNLLRSGADLKATSEVGGHSRPDTTLRVYDHVTKERHRQIIEKIPRLGLATILTTKIIRDKNETLH